MAKRISGALKGVLALAWSTAGRLAGLRRGRASEPTTTGGESHDKPAPMLKLADDDWSQMMPGGGGG